MVVEGNYYYNINTCGIGFHGDAERNKVIGLRLGATLPLVFQWYLQCKPVNEPKVISLSHGDIYIMSEKTVGKDWKTKRLIL